MKSQIQSYYDQLASTYDADRFGNSYGRYIHKQESAVLSKYLDRSSSKQNLDVACGTGRFLHYAGYGVDISEQMIREAKAKHPDTELRQGDIESLPFEAGFFNNVLSFHLMMHLDIDTLKKGLTEVHRVLKKGGYFIFDIPSGRRRQLRRQTGESWHGAFSISKAELLQIIRGQWQLVDFHGIAFFPVHRIPVFLRSRLVKADSLFGQQSVERVCFPFDFCT